MEKINYNINEYHPDVEIRNFPALEKELEKYYDVFIKTEKIHHFTPRGRLEFRIAHKEIFYYISWLYDDNPQNVIDIGSGEGVFRKWFPNIIHLQPGKNIFVKDNIDIDTSFNKDFVNDSLRKYDAGMALNSLHFGNIKILEENIHDAMKIIKLNSRFLFTINLDMIFTNYGYNEMKPMECLELLKSTIYNLPYKKILFDCPYDRDKKYDMGMNQYNGSIRVILENS